MIVGKWSVASRQNTLAAALKEWGMLRRTVHLAKYLSDPAFRRKISRQLNKSESLHALRRDLHYAQQGTITRPHPELRSQGREVSEEILSHISPGHSDNINFFGVINVDVEAELAKLDTSGWRLLRPVQLRELGLTP
ncbi:Tn3 family transposase [Nonomuraea sp. NEAU-A123]|nr:Tn3 family transposase [Nonomuraea sp. NEAU-A123]MBT2225138.1 Tn3 family transposase [Nonomuraea sp. NEAU-A123]